MKVVLAVPNYARRISNVAQTTLGPPLGLAYMAAVAEGRGYEVSILDANALDLTDQETASRIVEKKPDVVGFTAVTPTGDQCGELVDELSRLLPSTIMTMGGIHPTAVPDQTMERFSSLDLIVRGEADTRFVDILDGLTQGRSYGDFPGVTYRDNDRIVSTPDAKDLEDLDKLPLPARHLLPMERYIGPDGDRFTTIVGARGCPGRCLYCSVNQSFGGVLRNRDPELVAAEMDECHQRFNTRVFGFVDDTFSTNRAWVKKLCDELISRKLPEKIRWLCLTRVDRVDPNLLRAMKAAGCFKVEFGIESGHQDVLNFLGKGTTIEQVRQAFSWARQAGLKTFAFVMLFSPAETRQTLAATRKLVFRADPDYLQASFCTPYPGTALAEYCRKEGIEVSDDWSRYVFLAGPTIDHPRFSRRQMIKLHKRLLRSFYLRPRIVFRLLKTAIQDGSWRGFFRTALKALVSLVKS